MGKFNASQWCCICNPELFKLLLIIFFLEVLAKLNNDPSTEKVMEICVTRLGARWVMRLCVVECLHLRKAFGPGLEKHQSGNSACTEILAVEVRWEVKGAGVTNECELIRDRG